MGKLLGEKIKLCYNDVIAVVGNNSVLLIYLELNESLLFCCHTVFGALIENLDPQQGQKNRRLFSHRYLNAVLCDNLLVVARCEF
jgi:hypothetical protein